MTDPKLVLRQFIREMNAWELRCAERMNDCIDGRADFDSLWANVKQEYRTIFNKHCTPDDIVSREYSFSDPPDYDPDKEIVVDVTEQSPGIVVITTEQEYGHRKRNRYTLVAEKDEWKIKRKQIEIETGELLDDPL